MERFFAWRSRTRPLLSADNLYNSGIIFLRSNQFEKAINAFDQANQLRPNHVDTLLY